MVCLTEIDKQSRVSVLVFHSKETEVSLLVLRWAAINEIVMTANTNESSSFQNPL